MGQTGSEVAQAIQSFGMKRRGKVIRVINNSMPVNDKLEARQIADILVTTITIDATPSIACNHCLPSNNY